MPAPRSTAERIADAHRRLESDVDAWIATAEAGTGVPYLIPLSYLWDGEALLISTPATSITGRNLQANGAVKIGLGLTRDVLLIHATAETLTAAQLRDGEGDAFAKQTGFDPRAESNEYLYFRLTPRRVQSWREVNELAGRDIMRDGKWIASPE